jgi:hypothetical protein
MLLEKKAAGGKGSVTAVSRNEPVDERFKCTRFSHMSAPSGQVFLRVCCSSLRCSPPPRHGQGRPSHLARSPPSRCTRRSTETSGSSGMQCGARKSGNRCTQKNSSVSRHICATNSKWAGWGQQPLPKLSMHTSQVVICMHRGRGLECNQVRMLLPQTMLSSTSP